MKHTKAVGLVSVLATTYRKAAWSKEAIELFASRLLDLDYEPTRAAVLRWIDTQTEEPTPAHIRAAVRAEQERRGAIPRDLDVDEAFGIMLRTVRTSGRYRAYPDTYPAIKAVVDRMGLEDICNSDHVDVLRAQFERFYRAELERRHEERHASPGLTQPDDVARLSPTSTSVFPVSNRRELPSPAAREDVRRLLHDLSERLTVDAQPTCAREALPASVPLREPTVAEERAAAERKAFLRKQQRQLKGSR